VKYIKKVVEKESGQLGEIQGASDSVPAPFGVHFPGSAEKLKAGIFILPPLSLCAAVAFLI